MRRKTWKKIVDKKGKPVGPCIVCSHMHYRLEGLWVINGLGEILCINTSSNCFNKRRKSISKKVGDKVLSNTSKDDIDHSYIKPSSIQKQLPQKLLTKKELFQSYKESSIERDYKKVIGDTAKALNPYYSLSKAKRERSGTLQWRWDRVWKKLEVNLSRDNYAILLKKTSNFKNPIEKEKWIASMEKVLGIKRSF